MRFRAGAAVAVALAAAAGGIAAARRSATIERWRSNIARSSAPSPGFYDRLASVALGGLYRRVAADIGAVLATGDALEIGSGPGHLAVEVGRSQPGLRMTASDVDPGMVDLARRRADGSGVASRVQVDVADVGALPYADSSFDLVFSLASMHHWPDREAGLAEIHRVLRPGGRALIFDIGDSIRHYEDRRPAAAAAVAASPFGDGEIRPFRWPWRLPLLIRLELRKPTGASGRAPAPTMPSAPVSAPVVAGTPTHEIGPAAAGGPASSSPLDGPTADPDPATGPVMTPRRGTIAGRPPASSGAAGSADRSARRRGARHVRAYVGLGANVGDAPATLAAAVAALQAMPGVHLAGVSRLYLTRPVGVTDQPDFHNAAVGLDVPAGPDATTGAQALLLALKQIERALGRQHRARWGPRELDLDLLLFGRAQLSVDRPEGAGSSAPDETPRLLQIPHPAARDRLFVLAPLADLAPRLTPPGWSESVARACARREDAEGPDAVRTVGRWDATAGRWTADETA